MKATIKSMVGIFGRDETEDFKKFNLSIGDEVEVTRFTSNSFWYQPIPKGDVLFIYQHNLTLPNTTE